MRTNLSKKQGFSFIEILVVLAVFAVMLLAIEQTEFQSAQAINQDYAKEISLVLAHNTYEKNYTLHQ